MRKNITTTLRKENLFPVIIPKSNDDHYGATNNSAAHDPCNNLPSVEQDPSNS